MNILCVCLSATIQRTLSFESFVTGAVNRTQQWREDASGKALNAARVLNQLEAGSALALCPVGNDNADQFMALASNDADLSVHPVYIEGRTRECWTILDEKHASTTEVIADEKRGSHQLAGAEAEMELLELVREYMDSYDALLLAGSRPEQWSANMCARLCVVALQKGKTVLTDFHGKDLLSTLAICTPHIIKINEEEFCQTFGGLLLSGEELAQAVTEKSAELHNIVVVTRGEKETFAAQDGKAYTQNAEDVAVVNTTACGDAFAAGFLHEYLASADMPRALQVATDCASRNAATVVPGSIL